jgi:hypothetical protein
MSSRSSSISSRLFSSASSEEIAALKTKLELQTTELAALKTSGFGVSETALSDAVKPVSDKLDALNLSTITQLADIGKKASDAAFNAQEALTQAVAGAVELSKIPGLIQDANYNTNSKTSEIRGSVQDLTVKHDALAATVENMRQTMITVDGKIASIEGVHGQVIADLQTSLTALAARVSVVEGII